MNDATEKYIHQLKEKHGEIELVSAGSSLKLCLVAEGSADLYPRLGTTMEWDTAAAQGVVVGTGKSVRNYTNREPLTYNKEDLLNPWFVAGVSD
jgi:3'(2'), 5'-bisphosphate nucleotidase